MGGPGTRTVVRSARLWDGRGDQVVCPGFVAVAGEKIIESGKGPPPGQYHGWAELDLGDVTVLPGMVDAHIHLCLEGSADPFGPETMGLDMPLLTLRAARCARETLLGGITAARDCGDAGYASLAIRRAIEAGWFSGPRLRAAGKLITMTGGQGHPIGREADGIDDCRRAAREQLKAGADLIKVMATGGVLTPGSQPGQPQLELEELAAAVAEGRKAGRPAAAHAQGPAGIKNAILAGVRSIEHGIGLTSETADLMAARGVFLVPTLSAARNILKEGTAGGIPPHAVAKTEAVFETHLESLALANRAGVKIAMGSDAGTPFNLHGDNLQEITYLVEAGLSPPDALRAATSLAAELLGLTGTAGTLEAGNDADLVALRGDALADQRDLPGRVCCVMQRGLLVSETQDPGR